jgi:hypothetical protein
MPYERFNNGRREVWSGGMFGGFVDAGDRIRRDGVIESWRGGAMSGGYLDTGRRIRPDGVVERWSGGIIGGGYTPYR